MFYDCDNDWKCPNDGFRDTKCQVLVMPTLAISMTLSAKLTIPEAEEVDDRLTGRKSFMLI